MYKSTHMRLPLFCKRIEGFGERFLVPTPSQKTHPAFFLASAPENFLVTFIWLPENFPV
jgi:hypothetical protein